MYVILSLIFLLLKIVSSETLSNALLRDLNRLYNDTDNYDVIIQVGEGFNSEVFKAHSNILRIRSTYFNAALSSNLTKKEGNVITLKNQILSLLSLRLF